MNKFGKILACTLGVVTVAGAVGTMCYYEIPAFKTTADKWLKRTEDKANIGLDVKDNTPTNPNEIIPITPEAFEATYKVVLPSDYLGGQVYAKKLTNGNLFISSSVATGLLYYDASANTTKQVYMEGSSWNYINELDNGDVFICSQSNQGLLIFKSEAKQAEMLTSAYQISRFFKLSSGNYALFCDAYKCLYIDAQTYKVETIWSKSSWSLENLIDLGSDKFLLATGNSNFGLDYYDHTTMSTAQKICDTVSYIKEIFRDDTQVVFMSNYTKLLSFKFEDLSVETLAEFTSIGSKIYDIKYYGNNILLLASGGMYRLDKTTYEVEKLCSLSNYSYSVDNIALKDGNQLITIKSSTSLDIYFLNITEFSVSKLGIMKGSEFFIHKYDNGDIFFGGLSLPNGYTEYSQYFSSTTNTLKNLWPYTNGFGYVLLPNDKILALTTNGSQGLYLFNPADCSYKVLCRFTSADGQGLIEQKDGTVLIETGEDIKYEYDYKTDTLRLVYVAEM